MILDSFKQITLEYKNEQINVFSKGEGQTIAFLSGFGSFFPLAEFYELANVLSKNYHCLIIDRFGYGLSSHVDIPRTFDNLIEEIHTVLTKLNINKYYLLGHSFGTFISLNYAKKYDVDGLILLDGFYPESDISDLEEEILAVLDQKNSISFDMINSIPDNEILAEYPYINDEELKKRVIQCFKKNTLNPTMVNELLDTKEELIDICHNLDAVHCDKTLLFCSNNSLGNANLIKKTLPKAMIIELHTSEHYLHKTHYREISEKLCNIL